MTETRVPGEWVGQKVVAVIMQGWLDEADKQRGITALEQEIVIESIHEFGITARTPASRDPALYFYPWSSVLSIREP
jgi:hypothetical protein